MATSGTISFTVNRDEIITEALELLAVLGEGETPTEDQLTSSSRTLNMMIKNWQAEGLNLFSVRRQYLFLDKGRKEYPLGCLGGSTSNDKEKVRSTYQFNKDVLTEAPVESDTYFYVEDTEGYSVGDTVGFQDSQRFFLV